MLCVQIQNLKKMTALLFTEDTFDKFQTYQLEIRSEYQTVISGKRLRKDEEDDSPCVPWREIRPIALKIISGKNLPEGFKIILLTDPRSTDFIRRKSGFSGNGISSFSLNIVYQNEALTVSGGVSYESFTMDKSAEAYWDDMLRKFLTEKEVEFSES